MHDCIYISSFVPPTYLFIRSFRFILIANNDNLAIALNHRIFGINLGTNVFGKDFKINRSVQAMSLL